MNINHIIITVITTNRIITAVIIKTTNISWGR